MQGMQTGSQTGLPSGTQAGIQPGPRQAERRRVQAVVETLAGMRHRGGTVGEIAHDARNMVAALVLYCDLLAEPGVMAPEFAHYANELRLVTAASRRLVEKLMLLDRIRPVDSGDAARTVPAGSRLLGQGSAAIEPPSHDSIENLQQEVLATRNLLDALSGQGTVVRVRTEGGARPVRLRSEDLTRILVNLVRNAAEAMHGAGVIEITLRELPGPQAGVSAVTLAIEDTGPGIPGDLLDKIFEPGFTTRTHGANRTQEGGWPVAHRGLGLFITRSILEAAGGRIAAANRPEGGARFEIELPVRGR